MQYFRLGILTSTKRRIYFSQKEHDFGHLEYEYFSKLLVECQITSENITLYVSLH